MCFSKQIYRCQNSTDEELESSVYRISAVFCLRDDWQIIFLSTDQGAYTPHGANLIISQ